MEPYGDWHGRELERSPRFAQECGRLRAEANRSRRASKPFAEFDSVEEMAAAVNNSRTRPWHERRYRWTDKRMMERKWRPAPAFDVSLRDLDYYARRLQTQAYYFTGASSNANALHGYVCGSAPGIPMAGAIASMPAPTGLGASSIAAGFNGDMRWAPATCRQAFNRHVADVDATGPTFYYREQKGGVQMSAEQPDEKPPVTTVPREERGIVTDVIVPIVGSGVAGTAGGTANAVVSNALKKKDK